jgi:hypothetical protein
MAKDPIQPRHPYTLRLLVQGIWLLYRIKVNSHNNPPQGWLQSLCGWGASYNFTKLYNKNKTTIFSLLYIVISLWIYQHTCECRMIVNNIDIIICYFFFNNIRFFINTGMWGGGRLGSSPRAAPYLPRYQYDITIYVILS